MQLEYINFLSNVRINGEFLKHIYEIFCNLNHVSYYVLFDNISVFGEASIEKQVLRLYRLELEM